MAGNGSVWINNNCTLSRLSDVYAWCLGWSLFLKFWISSFSPLCCLLLHQLTMHTKYFSIWTMFRGSSMSFKFDLTCIRQRCMCLVIQYIFYILLEHLVLTYCTGGATVNMLPFWLLQTANCKQCVNCLFWLLNWKKCLVLLWQKLILLLLLEVRQPCGC